ncbi:MAG: hypothetical protein LBC26_01565, partial [Oscillospiraceae bacterium]|nr:hypothetical protein [Oscillospiraceae bacterium]
MKEKQNLRRTLSAMLVLALTLTLTPALALPARPDVTAAQIVAEEAGVDPTVEPAELPEPPASAEPSEPSGLQGLLRAAVQNTNQLFCGAAIRDITPTEDMLPIHAGNARMGLRLVGVIEGLHVRVIALKNEGGPTSLIVSVETGKGPYPPDFIRWLSEATGVAEGHIFWSATHV